MSDLALPGIRACCGAVALFEGEADASAGISAAAAEVARNSRREIGASISLVGVDQLAGIQQGVTEISQREAGITAANGALRFEELA